MIHVSLKHEAYCCTVYNTTSLTALPSEFKFIITANVWNVLHAGPKSLPSSVACMNDTLRQSVPCVSQSLLQIGHVSNWRLINTVLHDTLYSIVYGVKIRTVWRPWVWSNEFRSFTLKELDRLMRTIRWCTVLLEYVSVISNGTNGWQHLRRQ